MKAVNSCCNLFAATTSNHLLLNFYKQQLDKKKLLPDPEQKILIQALQTIFNQFIIGNEYCVTSTSYKTKLLSFLGYHPSSIPCKQLKGLYIWGGVGRGKTYFMNMFYAQLPTKRKRRLHFHRFMQWLHEELEQSAGIINPLQVIAKKMSKAVCILCLDEIHVTDITDAMLLGKLFEYLFDENIVLITTSNRSPDNLYKNGLQREHFLPAIALLKQQTIIIKMGGTLDYRLQALKKYNVYYLLNDPMAEQQLAAHYQHLSGICLHKNSTNIIINKRTITVKKWVDSVVWFDFNTLCNTARSIEDYTQIGKIFQTVLISAIPVMNDSNNDAARRFINMIDVFYDLQVNIIVSAETEPKQLYQATQLAIEFKRTISRLHEMQSRNYLMCKHTL